MDDGHLELLRYDFDGAPIREKRMFGGVAFMLAGNMVAGVFGNGLFYRVGKMREAEALALPHVAPFALTGRRMAGLVVLEGEAIADDALRERLQRLATDFVRELPPK